MKCANSSFSTKSNGEGGNIKFCSGVHSLNVFAMSVIPHSPLVTSGPRSPDYWDRLHWERDLPECFFQFGHHSLFQEGRCCSDFAYSILKAVVWTLLGVSPSVHATTTCLPLKVIWGTPANFTLLLAEAMIGSPSVPPDRT